MHLTYSSRLAIAMMAVLLVVFALVQRLVRRVPWTDASPPERFRWPVWSWYPLLIITGLLIGLGANILYMQRPSTANRLPRHDRAEELQMQRGGEETPPAATPAP